MKTPRPRQRETLTNRPAGKLEDKLFERINGAILARADALQASNKQQAQEMTLVVRSEGEQTRAAVRKEAELSRTQQELMEQVGSMGHLMSSDMIVSGPNL